MDGVGAVHTGVGQDSVGSIWHGTVGTGSEDKGGVGFGLPLPAARHLGSLNVGADANVGGVGHAEGSVGNGVGSSGVGDGMGSESVGVGNSTVRVNQGGVSLGLPLAVDGIGVAGVGVAIGVGHCSSNSGVGEARNLDSAMVGGGGDHSSVGLTSQNLADGVRVGLTSDSSHQGNNNEGFHIETSLADCAWAWLDSGLYSLQH